jgi:hypothetical protein
MVKYVYLSVDEDLFLCCSLTPSSFSSDHKNLQKCIHSYTELLQSSVVLLFLVMFSR